MASEVELLHGNHDPRLAAADRTLDEFLGSIEPMGDAASPEMLVEEAARSRRWATLPELPLIEPRPGYSLRCRVPAKMREVYLLHEGNVVGMFVENDILAIVPSHQGQHLSRELILAAYAQNPWKNPERKASRAGRAALESAYRFARFAKDATTAQQHGQ